MKKSWLLFILQLLMLMVYGQAGNSPEGIIKDKLKKYCGSVPWEEIYIHTDRDDYIAGEDLWFNIYLIDRSNNILTDHSSLAYIELLNPDNRQVIGKRIMLDNGLGPGHILLPDTLSTGRYIIRAYTSWMRNFLPYNCYRREILIYNALSDRILKGKAGDVKFRQPSAEESKIARKDGVEIDLLINREQSGITEITLIADNSFRSAGNDKCSMLIQTHGVVNLVRTVNLQSGTVKIIVPDEILIPGINQIVIFNSVLKPLAERFIYTPGKPVEEFKISTADTFSTREKVEIIIVREMTGSESLSPLYASLSVSSGTGRNGGSDITDYMVFGSEFGFLPESFRNRRIDEIPVDSIDSFLLTAKSNWIDWNYVMSAKLPELKYNAEKERHIITGQLIQKNTLEPLTGKYMFLSLPGKTATFQYSKTDSTGTFSFEVPVNVKINDLIIQPEEPDLKSSVMIGTPFGKDLLKNDDSSDTSVLAIPEYLSKWGVNYQVSKIYGIPNTADPISESILYPVTERFYGKPDIELVMNDFLLLPLMEEVFFELTPGVLLRRKKSTYSMTIADPVSGRIYEKPPVLLIDGVVVNDASLIAGLEPETVEKIDIVKDLYMVGDYIFFGIVNVITKAGDFRMAMLPGNAVRLKYRVVEPVPSFSSPDYSDEELQRSRIPDFRNTLYWSPSIKPSADSSSVIEFWTSDGTGSFDITLQGVNNQGMPVLFRKTITVR